jgi:hypothetical protein
LLLSFLVCCRQCLWHPAHELSQADINLPDAGASGAPSGSQLSLPLLLLCRCKEGQCLLHVAVEEGSFCLIS